MQSGHVHQQSVLVVVHCNHFFSGRQSLPDPLKNYFVVTAKLSGVDAKGLFKTGQDSENKVFNSVKDLFVYNPKTDFEKREGYSIGKL